MASKFFHNSTGKTTIKEQLAQLAKGAATPATGKLKNMKAQFNGAKKKAGTMGGSQRGS